MLEAMKLKKQSLKGLQGGQVRIITISSLKGGVGKTTLSAFLSLAKRVSKDFVISESTAKKHLAEIRNPECKTASGNTLKARQNAQERSGRTQKGGQGQSLDEAKTRTKAYLNDIMRFLF